MKVIPAPFCSSGIVICCGDGGKQLERRMIIYLCVASFSCCVLKLGGVAHPILPNKYQQHAHASLQTLTHRCAFFLFFLEK